MANLRNHTVIIASLSVESCTGGPGFTVTYEGGEDASDANIGDYVYIEHREEGDSGGDVISTYVYYITAKTTGGLEGGGDTLSMKYVYDTNEDGSTSTSPCDLNSGEGSSGSPEDAPHKVVQVHGPAFEMFMD
jgi:hypothetical protein